MKVKDYLISETNSMIEALKQLDRVENKILFVESSGKLVGALTDGDVRRWILKKGNLESKVKEVANYNPIFVNESERDLAKIKLAEYKIEAIPVINHESKVVSIIFRDDEELGIERNLDVPVVIMAGGLGTRLYPYTKILPKPLIPIGDLPIVEHIINRFTRHGCNDFYLILNHKKNMIKAYFNEIEKAYNMEFIDEITPLGTGGGLSLLKGKINTPFILSNCDILIEEDFEKIYKFHIKEQNYITMICSLKNIKIPYGVVEINKDGSIESMREKPEFNFFTNTGMYVVDSKVIFELEENQNIGFPDLIEKYRLQGYKVGVYPISEGSWMDMGQLEELEIMRDRLEKNE